MSKWSLDPLREYIQSSDLADKGRPLNIISSIDRSVQIFNYHISTAKDANNRLTPNTPKEALELVLTPPERLESIYLDKLIVQANIQGAVHSVRAIFDIFAQLLNCLVLSDAIPVHSCNLIRATDKLKQSFLKIHLRELQESKEYSYVNAMVNTIKHRNLVLFGAQVSLVTDEAGVQFQSFQYDNKNYPALWSEQVLQHASVVMNSVISAGQLLNDSIDA